MPGTDDGRRTVPQDDARVPLSDSELPSSVYRTFFDHAREGRAIIKRSGAIASFNTAFAEFCELPSERVMKLGASGLIEKLVDREGEPEAAARVRDFLVRYLSSGVELERSPPTQIPVRTAKGRKRVAEVTLFPVELDGDFLIAAIVRDVTEAAQAARFLERAVTQRDILLKELVHRIKNNVSLIASLLSFARREMETERDAEVIKQARDRLMAVSLLYDIIHGSGDFNTVLLDAYLERLARAVEGSTGCNPIEFAVQPVVIRQNAALPVGLVVNELLTNALKYAWRDRPQGLLKVRGGASDGMVSIAVEDDGDGMKEGWKPGLGTTIGTALAEQLDGTLVHAPREGGGTVATLTFPA
ncbi:MAG: PAS domain S-box protein [Spirochaetales bacterium]|nr:PAS domain S-box protein [Spirochaetales bacterium]